jgi:hypothetical protein
VLRQQIIFCEKYNINANELMLLEILLIAQNGDDPETVKIYFTSRFKGSIRDLLVNLQEAGVILKSYKIPEKGQSFNPIDIPLNKNLVKDFYKSSFEMGQELFEAYPISTIVNGSEYKLRRVSKKFDSLEDAFRAYGKAIRNKPEMHKKILSLIEEGKNSGYNFTNLGDFIVDNDWLNMELIAKDGILTNSSLKLL